MNSIKRACEAIGGQVALANALGVSKAAVNQWVSGGRPVPPRHCVAIEQILDGAISRCELYGQGAELIWPESCTPQKVGAGSTAPEQEVA